MLPLELQRRIASGEVREPLWYCGPTGVRVQDVLDASPEDVGRLRPNVSEVAGEASRRTRYATPKRITHGRHCTCSACARENWGDPALAPCGMHGPSCPGTYAPLGPAGELVPAETPEQQ